MPNFNGAKETSLPHWSEVPIQWEYKWIESGLLKCHSKWALVVDLYSCPLRTLYQVYGRVKHLHQILPLLKYIRFSLGKQNNACVVLNLIRKKIFLYLLAHGASQTQTASPNC